MPDIACALDSHQTFLDLSLIDLMRSLHDIACLPGVVVWLVCFANQLTIGGFPCMSVQRIKGVNLW